MKELPKTYNHTEIESRWKEYWEDMQLHAWDPKRPRSETFVVDTPPPTVSGSLHVGHVFSYTHTDVIARFQRMLGKNIFYPMGWDDNGLPTERRVQNKFGITCNPKLSYDPAWAPKEKADKDNSREEISRRNFIEACSLVTTEDEAAFENLWRQLGLSIDWKQQYATIDAHCRKISQISFLDLVEKNLVYNLDAPVMWDTTFQTGLAQADLEDRVIPGAFHDIRFTMSEQSESNGEFVISTTRPELLAACIAVVAHPSDERYKKLFGKFAITPLFENKVPILAAEHADPEKGTGILMVCTFGDGMDVEWWKSSGLPIKQIVAPNGRLLPIDFSKEPFNSQSVERATKAWSQLQGLKTDAAKKKIAELLAEEGSAVGGKGVALVGEPKKIEHAVKFYEKGDKPVEFLTTRQWFVRLLEHKKELVAQGEKISWHPEHMKSRYTNWVDGLAHDWCISRQRYFGVSFPVWYKIDAVGRTDYAAPIYAKREQLPIDPLSDLPQGYTESQRDQPNGFTGDPDVMDTWATSALTPQLMSYWTQNEERHEKLFPMDIRPQSHEIIRTWAFYTIAKAWMHSGEIPWKNVIISGWILDPDRKKMSKSKGNVVTPGHLLEQYSSDGVRYWAARARMGVDTAFDEKVFKSGQKLVLKLFNAGKFVHTLGEDFSGDPLSAVTVPLDLSLIQEMKTVVESATAAMNEFQFASALQTAEFMFWKFCDNYLELVKGRAYNSIDEAEKRSAKGTLLWSLKTFLKLFAPVLPYVTEEIWSWRFAGENTSKSIHTERWPSVEELQGLATENYQGLLEVAAAAISGIYSQKTLNQKSLGTPLISATVKGIKEDLALIEKCRADIENAAKLSPGGLKLEIAEPTGDLRFVATVEF
jgi:valyl-tRNA synthetase